MSDKFSVYNGLQGSGPPMPPPPRQSPIHFKRDGYLSSSFLTSSSKLEDSIRMEEASAKEMETLSKLFGLLLSRIFIKWGKFGPKKGKKGTPIRKERPAKVPKLYFQKFEKKLEESLIKFGRFCQRLARPSIVATRRVADFIGRTYQKGEDKAVASFEKWVSKPANIIYAKTTPPIIKTFKFIERKMTSATILLEKEGERIINTLAPPLNRATKKGKELTHLLLSPLRKTKNFLERKIMALPRPEFPRAAFEKFLVKPCRAVINTMIAEPLRHGFVKISYPIGKASKFLYKRSKIALLFFSNVARGVGSVIASSIEKRLLKMGSFLLRFLKIFIAIFYYIWRFLRSLPSRILKGGMRVFYSFGRLTLWAKTLVSNT